jgi:nucleoside-diphosphate-sugar epimerase
MKKVFLTGAGGFIGGYLAKRLLTDGYEVHGLAMEDSHHAEEDSLVPHIQWHYGNLIDFEKIGEILKEVNPNFIIHLAARTEVEKSFYDPIDFQLVNYNGTVNLIEKSKDLPTLELFVFASTMETYGAVPKEDWKAFDEKTIQYPNAPYAVAKVACEYYLKYAQRAYGFPFAAFRQTNSYGRHDNDFFVVEAIITQMLGNADEINLGYREPYRNFLFIDDLIDLYCTVLKNVDLAKGEIFCTGPDNAIQISKLAEMIAQKLDWHGKINWGTRPKRAGEIYYLNSTPEKAKRILGWEPQTALNDGLDATIKMWKEKNASPQSEVHTEQPSGTPL